MDITLLSENSIKIKGKKASFIIDPEKEMQKNNADAIILLGNNSVDLSRVTDSRVVIDGAGEYEVGRCKINGIRSGEDIVYSLNIDNIDILVGKASSLNNVVDKLQEQKVAVINVDSEIKESIVTAIEPRLVVFYGQKREEAVKALGKETSEVEKTKKLSFNEDKLPEEMGVAVLS